eukprot:m.24622 g.24622  ORF g.24622 m.24622 type:complete len:471 (-) comp11536_c0_seq2:138-1550(-)
MEAQAVAADTSRNPASLSRPKSAPSSHPPPLLRAKSLAGDGRQLPSSSQSLSFSQDSPHTRRRNWLRRRVTSLFQSGTVPEEASAIDFATLRCARHRDQTTTELSDGGAVFAEPAEADCPTCASYRSQALSSSHGSKGLRARLGRLRHGSGSAPSLAPKDTRNRGRSRSPHGLSVSNRTNQDSSAPPMPQRSSSKVLAKGLRKAVRPWKWGRPKSSKLAETATRLERRLSIRPSPAQAVAAGILKQDAVDEAMPTRRVAQNAPRLSIDITEECSVVDDESVILPPPPPVPHYADVEQQQAAIDGNPADNWLAVKLSLKRKLARRPSSAEVSARGIMTPPPSETAKSELQTKLNRRLSIRSERSSLEARNILRDASDEELSERRASVVSRLSRKLSERVSIHELKEKKILKFDAYAEVTETWSRDAYDRRADKPWTRLTNTDKMFIRRELNEFKRVEMDVHPDSEHFTRFH